MLDLLIGSTAGFIVGYVVATAIHLRNLVRSSFDDMDFLQELYLKD